MIFDDTKPALRWADIRGISSGYPASGWIFRDVRMEPANNNVLTAQSAVCGPFRPIKRETRTGSILTSRKIHPEAGYPADIRPPEIGFCRLEPEAKLVIHPLDIRQMSKMKKMTHIRRISSGRIKTFASYTRLQQRTRLLGRMQDFIISASGTRGPDGICKLSQNI